MESHVLGGFRVLAPDKVISDELRLRIWSADNLMENVNWGTEINVARKDHADSMSSAPDFTLLDQAGNPWTLSEQRGRGVVLLFLRGDW